MTEEQGCFLFAHLNIRSLSAHIMELREIVEQSSFDILAVSETWLLPTIKSDDVALPGFQMVRLDRSSSDYRRGGGIVIYVRDGIKFDTDIILDRITCTHPDLEQLWITVTLENKKIGLCAFYRRPHLSLASLSALESSLSMVLPSVSEIVCLGDLNVNLLNHSDPCSIAMERLLKGLGLRQLIKEPTRITNSSATLIDVVIVSNTLKVLRAGTISTHGVSDHLLIYCAIECVKPKVIPKFHIIRNFKNFDREALDRDAAATNWNEVIAHPGIDDKVQCLNNNIMRICDLHAPVRVIRITKPRAPWFTKTIEIMIRERNRIWTRCRKTRSDADWDQYRKMRNETLTAIRREKQAYVTYKLKHLQSKDFWQGIRCLGAHKCKNATLPSHFNNPTVINDHFLDSLPPASVDENVINCFNSRVHPDITEPFTFKLVSVDQVRMAAYSIKGRSAGWDGISGDMVFLVLHYCLPALTHIFNYAFESGTFPTFWKNALIRPIQKISDPRSLSDLRPIAILCFLSKIFERLCYEQMSAHFVHFNLLPEQQSGFRKGHSTTTALLKVSDDILHAFDKSQTTALVLLDFSRAFDTLDHGLLLAKLAYYGFDQVALSWMQNYLFNRTQQVELQDGVMPTRSPCRAIKSGVPQGSLLGPLLFSIYAADLNLVLQHTVSHMYADDVQLYVSFQPGNAEMALARLNQDLANGLNWASKNALYLNYKKIR